MRVLVTGGAGFVGSHVAEHCARAGKEVVILDNFTRARILGKNAGVSSYNWDYLKRNYPSIRLVMGDVRDFDKVRSASDSVDAIIHTAAQVAVTTSLTDARTDFEINALGTFNILEAARLNDSAVVFCSTNKVYGENVNKIPLKEENNRYVFADTKYFRGIPEDFPTDLCWHTPYGCSKLAADTYVQDYSYTYGLKTGVFRMSSIYGERQFGVEDQGWVAWFAIASSTNRPITIYGDGKQVRDILHVSDLSEAFDKFLTSRLKHEVFNVGGGPNNTLSLLELIDLLETRLGRKISVNFSGWRDADQKVYVSDISKAGHLLAWTPAVMARNGVTRLVQWISSNLISLP